MLSSNTNFDTKHALSNKDPMYLVHFDGEAVDYCDHKPTLPDNTLAQYLVKISGLSQKVTPEEGRASVGGVSAEILDYSTKEQWITYPAWLVTFVDGDVVFLDGDVVWNNTDHPLKTVSLGGATSDEITALLATDTYYFHRKKTTVKAGYQGMAEADMLTIMTGWITSLRLDRTGLNYRLGITDPQKWMQRKIFRGSEDSTVTLSGNPLNILLSVLTSTGAGTNGAYDYLAAVNSLGIDQAHIDVSGIEGVRDDWFPGNSHYMSFSMSKRIKAKDFIEKEILKTLNLYPVIDGQGRFSIKPFKPPLPASDSQSVDKDTIIGMPQWDNNLTALVNEVECHYDWNTTTEVYDTIDFYADATSITNRGPGKKPIVLKSKGLTTAKGGFDVMATRASRIFERFAVPPVKISFNTFFSKWLVEAGDIISFTHPNMPDVEAGTRGLTAKRMEVTSRSVDWKRGRVKIDLLDTGFGKGKYGVISPTMTVVSSVSQKSFVVSVADAVKYSNLTSPEVQLCTLKMRQKVAAKTILTVNTTTGEITCDDMGVKVVPADIVLFADYDSCTTEQKDWGFIADASDNLGAANDDAHLIVL